MEKTFFQKTFNLSRYLLAFVIINTILSITSRLLIILFNNEVFSRKIIVIQNKLYLVSMIFLLVAIMLFLLLLTLLIIELIGRYKTDKISNYFESVKQTMRLRYFLIQHPSAIMPNNSISPILRDFNRSISSCIVDVRNESVVVVLKYPTSQQSQQIFRSMESHIKEEISNYNPKFYFSSAVRIGNKLFYKGSKR
jgi:putative membrane protein